MTRVAKFCGMDNTNNMEIEKIDLNIDNEFSEWIKELTELVEQTMGIPKIYFGIDFANPGTKSMSLFNINKNNEFQELRVRQFRVNSGI